MSAPIIPAFSASLPIDPLLPAIAEALAEHTSVILEAPPGAGKTTRVPLALLDQPWLAGQKILLLEPRRLATRAAAQRMASTLGERVGDTVGYQIRLDRAIGPRTRIEVITEGILTRRLQDDAGLDGVGLVIFDEFHERSLDADLGLALTLDMQKGLRPDLRLMVMSATLDGASLTKLLTDAPVLRSAGRSFPVETRYLDAPLPNRVAPAMASAIRKAIAETRGDVLAFLPGEREIRNAAAQVRDGTDDKVLILPLYGALSQAEQDRVFAPAPKGVRKVVLATAIAETSLTIDGITVVIDSGLARVPRFDPVTGLTRLETVKVSQAAAEQRRGRGGRTAPGVCYRLWPEPATRGLPLRATPEILQADLAPLALELAVWGIGDPNSLAWLDAPAVGPYGQAQGLLRQLGALDSDGRATEHGRQMARLPLHPRLAHMALMAKRRGLGQEAALLAALLGERDVLSGTGALRDADLRHRLELIGGKPGSAASDARPGARRRIADVARQIRRLLDVPERATDARHAAMLVALAYPDRLAQRRGSGGFRMANGRGAVLPDEDPLAREGWLAIAEVGGGGVDGRIFLAAPISQDEIEGLFADQIDSVETVAWDSRTEAVAAHRQQRLGALVLGESGLRDAAPERVAAALADGVHQLGLAALPWTTEARQLQARVALLRALDGTDSSWPDISDVALRETLDTWLAPHLIGRRSRKDLARLDLLEILMAPLDWPRSRKLDELAPTHIAVPSGRSAALDYPAEQPAGDIAAPALSVKLQELFGLSETPRIANGRVPVVLHLLSPAGRPVQVTRDLANFWRTGYPEVKKDLKGRYPRHPWPDDPLTAVATAKTKRKSQP
jgi:ATP-dependent helicase HrpB